MKKGLQILLIAFSVQFTCACNRSSVTNNAQDFDSTFSFDKNPFGNWQVGYSSDTSLNPAKFVLSTYADTVRPVPLWHPSTGASGYYPYVGQNTDTITLADVSNQWAARKGQIAIEGNNNGQYGIVRFIVPEKSSYKITAVFEGIHYGLSSTDVHVLINEQSKFSAFINGYGGDPGFHAITGSNPTASFDETINLNKGDIITFAVGYGENKTFYNDTTGLLVSIKSI